MLLVILLFIVSSFLSRHYADYLQGLDVFKSALGIIFFVGITIVDVLLAVVTITPLIPAAVAIWGPFWAGTLVMVGWVAGSMVAFWLGRKYGEKAICRFFNLCSVAEFKGFFPKKKLFYLLVLARIFLPIDLISYAVGVFTNMRSGAYFLSTLIGTAVFSYVFSYGADFTLGWQIFFGGLIFFLFLAFYWRARKEYLAWLKDNR